jgi:hypothetical protein
MTPILMLQAGDLKLSGTSKPVDPITGDGDSTRRRCRVFRPSLAAVPHCTRELHFGGARFCARAFSPASSPKSFAGALRVTSVTRSPGAEHARASLGAFAPRPCNQAPGSRVACLDRFGELYPPTCPRHASRATIVLIAPATRSPGPLCT